MVKSDQLVPNRGSKKNKKIPSKKGGFSELKDSS